MQISYWKISKFSNLDTKCFEGTLDKLRRLIFSSAYGIYTIEIDSLIVYKSLTTHSPTSPNYNILVFNCKNFLTRKW